MATTRSGFLTLIGLPNAGKSSLMNRLVGEDIAIVTPKAQTTRVNMRGFVVRDGLRLSITDTPGLQEGAKALNQVLTRNAVLALKNASQGREALALVVDAIELIKRFERGELTGLEALPDLIVRHVGDSKIPAPVFPVFNKGDLVHSVAARAKCEGLLKPLLDAVFSDVRATHWISANLGKGVDELLAPKTVASVDRGKYFHLFLCCVGCVVNP
jgi:GTP-binding protein Era